MSNLRRVAITGTGSYVPERILTNTDLEKMVETSDEWIISRTGISQRRIAGEKETTVDLAVAAGKRALEDAGVLAEDLDLIIVATVTPHGLFPSVACGVQSRLGAKKAGAFDLGAACSGFIYALEVGRQFIASGSYNKVLVIGAETLSKFTDWEDRNTCILFGDGAGAVLLQPAKSQEAGILVSSLQADGLGGDLLKLEHGGFIEMNGSEVYRFAVRIMGEVVAEALEKAGLTTKDLDYLIPHQANTRIIQAAAKRLGLPMEKVHVNVNKYGNTSAASVPIALDEAVTTGKIKAGNTIALVGFGAGLTWAASILRWEKKGGETNA